MIGDDSMGVAEGVSTLGVESREEDDISDNEEDDFPSAEDISAAQAVVTPLGDLQPAVPSRPSVILSPNMPLFPRSNWAVGEGSSPPINTGISAEVDIDDVGQSAVESLRASLALTEEGSALHSSIKAALDFHNALMAQHHQKSKAASNVARGEARVTNELLRRLKSSVLSDDDDEDNDTPEEVAKRNLIRRRKNRRLIEKKKQDSEAKDSVMAPTDPLPPIRRLSDHHDFLAVQLFLMDLEEIVVRKEWCSAIEMWVFRQFHKGSKAHTAFNVHLKSGQGGLHLSYDSKCYFRDFYISER